MMAVKVVGCQGSMTYSELQQWLMEHGVSRAKLDGWSMKMLLNICTQKKARVMHQGAAKGYF